MNEKNEQGGFSIITTVYNDIYCVCSLETPNGTLVLHRF